MSVLLHEGHTHSETSSAALGPEITALVLLSLVILGVVTTYAVMRYAGD